MRLLGTKENMNSIEIIGGIKSENISFKSEKDPNNGESNIVEICAEDVENKIKKELEESENVDNGGNGIFELRAEDIEGEEEIKAEVDDNCRKKDINVTDIIKTGNVEEKLILNYTDDHLVTRKRKDQCTGKKIKNSNDENGNKIKTKRKRKRRLKCHNVDGDLNEKIEKNEYTVLEKNGGYRCHHCQALITSRRPLLKHILQNHRNPDIYLNKEEKLKQLATIVRTRYYAWYEYKPEGEDRYRCSHCKELFHRRSGIERHITNNHRNKDKLWSQCPLCPYKTKYYNDLRTHNISVHTAEKDLQYFWCDKCDYKTKLKNGLTRHIRSQHMNLLVQCHLCPKTFKKKESLDYHVKLIHNCDFIQKHKCSHCPYECKSKEGMRHHVQTRHTEPEDLETLQCPHCPYKTKYKQRMIGHNSVNHRRVLQCHICSYQCTNKSNLDLHLVGHKTDKNNQDLKYHCDKCDYKTHRTYSLTVHKLNHLKPEEIQYFYCYHCNFKAKRKDNLKTHVLRHFKQDEVPLACFVCEFTTQKRHILKRHLDNHSKEANKEKKALLKVFKIDNKHLERKKQDSKITDRGSKEEKI